GFAGAFTTYGTYIVASVGYVSLNGIAEAVSQSLGLLALGGACAWAGMRVGEWTCGRSGSRPVASEGDPA
ncbi:CrcB family protein, partial [Pauljensenia sp. UMB3104]|nr:CrcB family protein [Pauljensenia sp. UMB3104]